MSLTLGLMNALKYHWCETSLLSEAVLNMHVVSIDFKKYPVLYSAKYEEIYGNVPCQKSFMSCYIAEKKTSTCGSHVHGSHPDSSVGQ